MLKRGVKRGGFVIAFGDENPAEVTVSQIPTEPGTYDRDMRMKVGGTLTGPVVDSSGEPSEGLCLRVMGVCINLPGSSHMRRRAGPVHS